MPLDSILTLLWCTRVGRSTSQRSVMSGTVRPSRSPSRHTRTKRSRPGNVKHSPPLQLLPLCWSKGPWVTPGLRTNKLQMAASTTPIRSPAPFPAAILQSAGQLVLSRRTAVQRHGSVCEPTGHVAWGSHYGIHQPSNAEIKVANPSSVEGSDLGRGSLWVGMHAERPQLLLVILARAGQRIRSCQYAGASFGVLCP